MHDLWKGSSFFGLLILRFLLDVKLVSGELFLDCPSNPIPREHPRSIRIFQNTAQLCTDGFEYHCVPNPQGFDFIEAGEHAPLNDLDDDATVETWRTFCEQYCHCVDIQPQAPDLNTGQGEPIPIGQGDSEGDDSEGDEPPPTSSSDASEDGAPDWQRGFPTPQEHWCSHEIFGRPVYGDCSKALSKVALNLPFDEVDLMNGKDSDDSDSGSDISESDVPRITFYQDLVPIGDQWANAVRDHDLQRVKLPQRFTHGTCTITVSLPHDNDMWVGTWLHIYHSAAGTIFECVLDHGEGGMADYTRMWPVRVAVYGPKSLQSELETLQLSLRIQDPGESRNSNGPKRAIGSVIGQDPNPAAKRQQTMGASSSHQPVDAEDQTCLATDTTQCGKTCYSHEDCNLEKDYLCAIKKDFGLPQDVSWGRFRCTWVPNAMAAVMAATKFSRCRSGSRCLLEGNGDLVIEDAADDLVHVSENGTHHLPLNVSRTHNHSSTAQTTLPHTSSNHSLGLTNYTLGNHNMSTSTNKSQTSIGPVPGYSLSYEIFCPCNCTYVSNACCTSPTNNLTADDAILQVRMIDSNSTLSNSSFSSNSSQPPASPQGLTCDLTSGKWIVATDTNSTLQFRPHISENPAISKSSSLTQDGSMTNLTDNDAGSSSGSSNSGGTTTTATYVACGGLTTIPEECRPECPWQFVSDVDSGTPGRPVQRYGMCKSPEVSSMTGSMSRTGGAGSATATRAGEPP